MDMDLIQCHSVNCTPKATCNCMFTDAKFSRQKRPLKQLNDHHYVTLLKLPPIQTGREVLPLMENERVVKVFVGEGNFKVHVRLSIKLFVCACLCVCVL